MVASRGACAESRSHAVAYDLGRRATAARPPKARPGARVSQKFASRAILVFPKTSPAPRVPAVPSREPPSSRVPSALSRVHECVSPWLATHTRRGHWTVRPAGMCRAPATNAACVCVLEATMARPPPCFLTGQGGAYSRSARNRRSPPLPRPEQRRVDGSPFAVGRRESTRRSRAESQPHAPRACTPSQGEKILSARRAVQAGRRAGSGKTIPTLARDATRPSREAVRRAPPTHARLASTPRKTRGRPLTRLPSGPAQGWWRGLGR